MRRRTHEEILNPETVLFNLLKEYANGTLTSRQHYFRARVEAVDVDGGKLEARPPNPPNSVRARVYTAGLDSTTPREALTVFHPMFPPNHGATVQPGEHVLVIFEDESMTSGMWLTTVPAFHNLNYSNPDFRVSGSSTSSYVFEGDRQPQSQILTDLEYGGQSSATEGDQEIVDVAESQSDRNPWRNKRVLLFGDSQVAGPFGSFLGERLRGTEASSAFVKDGRVSWGVPHWLRGRLRSDSPQQSSIDTIISQNTPDIIIVSLGGNDGSSGYARRSDYTSKVTELWNQVKDRASIVIWAGPPTAVGRNSTRQPGRELAARKIRDVVGRAFVDVFGVTNTTDGRAPDGIHFRRGSPAFDAWADEIVRRAYRLGSND